MLKVHLAGSGSIVVIPDGVTVVSGPIYDEVHIVDDGGRTLVIFPRDALSVYTADGASASPLALPSRQADSEGA